MTNHHMLVKDFSFEEGVRLNTRLFNNTSIAAAAQAWQNSAVGGHRLAEALCTVVV